MADAIHFPCLNPNWIKNKWTWCNEILTEIWFLQLWALSLPGSMQEPKSLDEFLEIYSERPIKNNHGGVLAPHAFGLWFMARELAPDIIIESGVWRGMTTWLLEKACPEKRLKI